MWMDVRSVDLPAVFLNNFVRCEEERSGKDERNCLRRGEKKGKLVFNFWGGFVLFF